MRDWLNSVLGEDGSRVTQMLLALVIVVLLILLIAWAVRKFGLGGVKIGALGGTQNGERSRLAVVDASAVDGQRRLVLLRRDDVEHLVMIGGPNDVLVESRIVRNAPGLVRAPVMDAAPSPVPAPPRGPARSEPAALGPAPRAEMSPVAAPPGRANSVAADLKAALSEQRRRIVEQQKTEAQPREAATAQAATKPETDVEAEILVRTRPGAPQRAMPANVGGNPADPDEDDRTREEPTVTSAPRGSRPAPAPPEREAAARRAAESSDETEAARDIVAGEIERALADLATTMVPARGEPKPAASPPERQAPAVPERTAAEPAPEPARASASVTRPQRQANEPLNGSAPPRRPLPAQPPRTADQSIVLPDPQVPARPAPPPEPPSAIAALGDFAREQRNRKPEPPPPVKPAEAAPRPTGRAPMQARAAAPAHASNEAKPSQKGSAPKSPSDELEAEIAKLISELSGPPGR